MSTAMRLLTTLSLLLALATTSSGREPRAVLGERAEMTAEPVALFPGDPKRRELGALTYLGGVVLRSGDPAFGGFSAMRVRGDRFTLLSDGGNIVEFRMGADWQPREVRFGDLPGPGTGAFKWQRDAESMTTDPVTGRTWVGFEDSNAIWRYDPTLARAERFAQPPAMVDWPSAGGAESMVRLIDGRFLVLSETGRPRGMRKARELLRFAGDPTETKEEPERFAYVPPAGYDPSDAVQLPDGRLLVLNRRLALRGLFTAKLTVVDLATLAPGKPVQGREVATFAAPSLHDNFEALGVTREGADTILWIASDDNSQFWEKSLLLKFRLELGPEPARSG